MTSQTNENNVFKTRDKRNASDFIVRARWTVMPACEQMDPATWICSRNRSVKLIFTAECSIIHVIKKVDKCPLLANRQSIDHVNDFRLLATCLFCYSAAFVFVSRLIMTPLGMSHTPLQHHAWRRAASLSWPSEWPKGSSR